MSAYLDRPLRSPEQVQRDRLKRGDIVRQLGNDGRGLARVVGFDPEKPRVKVKFDHGGKPVWLQLTGVVPA